MERKLIINVFLILGCLLLGVLLYAVAFNTGGVVENGFSLMSTSMGDAYREFAEQPATRLLPAWDSTDTITEHSN